MKQNDNNVTCMAQVHQWADRRIRRKAAIPIGFSVDFYRMVK